MKSIRNTWLKLRVTPEEKKIVADNARAQDQTVTDFLW